MATLKSTKIDDLYAKGDVREDGLMVRDRYLMQAKTPAESKKPWDYCKVAATTRLQVTRRSTALPDRRVRY